MSEKDKVDNQVVESTTNSKTTTTKKTASKSTKTAKATKSEAKSKVDVEVAENDTAEKTSENTPATKTASKNATKSSKKTTATKKTSTKEETPKKATKSVDVKAEPQASGSVNMEALNEDSPLANYFKEEVKKAASSTKKRGSKSTSFDKENFDIDQISETEEAYIKEKRRIFLNDEVAEQYKDDSYKPSLLVPDAMTEYDYYVKERNLYTQSAIARGTNQLIMSGTIIGVDTTKNGIPYVVVKTDSVLTSQFKLQPVDIKHFISVRIPASGLIFNSEEIRNSKDTPEAGDIKLKKELEDRMFARIFYIAENFQEEKKLCWCSRVAAMLEMQRRSFYPTNDRPALLGSGDSTGARIVAVGNNKVTVEVDGVDCVLTRKNLSWLSLRPDLKKEFSVNDILKVKILSVGYKDKPFKFRDQNVNVLDVKVSKVAAEEDPANRYYNYYMHNPKATGVITSELTADGVYVRLAGMIDVLCDVSVDEPIIGAECKVKLLHAEQREDKKHDGQLRWFLKGIIKEVLPPRNERFYA